MAALATNAISEKKFLISKGAKTLMVLQVNKMEINKT